MNTDPLQQSYQCLGDQLVQRGFAQAWHYDKNKRTGVIVWNARGIELQRYLRQLFLDTKTKTTDLQPNHMADLVVFILFASPS